MILYLVKNIRSRILFILKVSQYDIRMLLEIFCLCIKFDFSSLFFSLIKFCSISVQARVILLQISYFTNSVSNGYKNVNLLNKSLEEYRELKIV
ncbi:hypothetical protein VNO78_11997 [Psophocarpus tetragonolobus]|uniref:Uncharacterized protein n=1 Tax=Psophocarpus tetragonolobus TaxID=3891 RepID=A0AAN9XPG6_PSOTE